MSNVSLKHLVKRYGTTNAVDDVSIEIAEGEFYSLLGPSGCGKSTTLRMLAGFEEITEGSIEIDGEDVSRLPPEQRGIGFVFQNYAIFPHMNIFENIAFGLRLRKVPELQLKAKVTAALEQVGMAGLGARMQTEISGGQQQRVALARVLVTEPKILLLDEPLSALDKNLREEMKFWIKDLQQSLGITTIYVTHDQGEALTMSDRIAVMKDGKIAQEGTPRAIYETPQNLFVANFIGESSLLTGTVISIDGDECGVQVGTHTPKAMNNGKLATGDEVRLVLRPEHAMIDDVCACGDNWNTLPSTVTASVYQGSSLRTVLDFEGLQIVSETANRLNVPHLEAGQMANVSWQIKAAPALKEEAV